MAAIAVVNSAQTPSTAAASLTITSATAGNALVCFISQVGSTVAPTLAGYTVEATDALFASSADSVWCAHKIAAGGEVAIAPTAGGGTIDGICYWEVSSTDNPLVLDQALTVLSNHAAAATGTVNVTTKVEGSLVLIGVGLAASSGTIAAWTTTVATNISTTASRMYGGSYLTTTPLSAAAFKANWQTSQVFGMLAVALQPVNIAAKAAETTNVTASAVGFVTIPATGTQTVGSYNDAGPVLDATYVIPGYQYPTLGLWNGLGSPAGGVGYIIANVNSGPGTTVDSNYTAAIAAAISAGWTVLGYVPTNNGVTSSTTVEAMVTKWSTLYGVHSIFFDQASTLSTKVSYYTTLTGFVHTASAGALSILNPGSPPYSGYMSTAVCDGICVFDNTYAAFQSTPPPNYANTGLLILHIVAATPLGNATTQMLASVALGANVLYVTDETDGNFDVLPTYFTGENILLANQATATAAESVAVTCTAVGFAVSTVAATGSFTASVTGSAVGFAAGATQTTNVTASAVGTVAIAAAAAQITSVTASAVGFAAGAALITSVTASAVGVVTIAATGSQTITAYNNAGAPLLASYLIPGYQYPTVGLWGASLGSPVGGVGYIIANPNSGPGTTVNPDYTTAIANAQAAGWTVLGYVDTNYAAVALATVEGNVDKWFSLYGIVNIFFDRASELSTKVSYATSLTSYVHTTHGAGRSIMNMGAAPYSGFLTPSVVDGIVVFDATYAAFGSTPPGNYSGYGIQIAHIVTATPLGSATSQMLASAALGADLLYVTDETDGNFDVLPTYFAGENVLLANQGTGAGTFSASVTCSAVGTIAATAAESVAVTTAAVGIVTIAGTAAESATVTTAAAGTVIAPDVGTGAFTASVTCSAVGTLAATAAQTTSFVGTAAGTLAATGSQTISVTASAAGTWASSASPGTAEQDTVYTGTAGATLAADGSFTASVSGSAVGAVVLPATAANTTSFVGLAVGTLGATGAFSASVSGSAVGSAVIPATAAQTTTTSSTAAATVLEAGSGTVTASVTSSAVGTISAPGAGSTTATVSANAVGTTSIAGTGNFVATVTGLAAGLDTEHAAASFDTTFTATATGSVVLDGAGESATTVTATATGAVIVSGSGAFVATFTSNAHGESVARADLFVACQVRNLLGTAQFRALLASAHERELTAASEPRNLATATKTRPLGVTIP
jgi:hypothetical protein